jgi:predicted Fe-S protein YdhL (DUF1289 family)
MAEPIARPFSPCTNQCLYDDRERICRGCLRTMPEILGWMNMTDAEREGVWQRLDAARLIDPRPAHPRSPAR